MLYYSTRKQSPEVSFREAVLRGLAPDGGLYMPQSIPRFSDDLIGKMPEMDFPTLSFHVGKHWVGEDVPSDLLESMIHEAFNFDVPLVRLPSRLHSLELFHGPTLAFKDFGARFMARLLAHFNHGQPELTILVATSGDTGSAVANGFYRVEGIKVVVLYPSGRVSKLQEQQMTTLGENITAIEVEGNFDDCQRLVKQAFQDPELCDSRRLTSANSINIARLLPQSFYYCFAWSRVCDDGVPVVFSVPSGNFGNLTAGIMAHRAGLPVKRFIAATNKNDVVPEYLHSGNFRPRPSVETISNAMDVGNPSNFDRMLDLYGSDFGRMKGEIAAFAFSDDQTRQAIQHVYASTGYVMDPHGAVAYLGAISHEDPDCPTIFLETAHPAKFHETVEPLIGRAVEIPERLKVSLKKPKLSVPLSAQYRELKSYLLFS